MLKDFVREKFRGWLRIDDATVATVTTTHRPAASNSQALVVGKVSRIYLTPFADIRLGARRRDLVKGLVPRVGLTVIWGEPKSGKSFFTFDMAMHVALGWDYRGRRVHQGPVVYCYFEGQAAASQRAEAFRQRHLAECAEAVPFYLMPVALSIWSQSAKLSLR